MKIKGNEIIYFIKDAHPTDVGLQFALLAKETLGKEPNFFPYPTDNPFRKSDDYPPSWVIREVAPGVQQPVISRCRLDLPFGQVDYSPERLVLLPGMNLSAQQKAEFVAFGTKLEHRAISKSIFKGKIIDSRFHFLAWPCPPVILRPDKQAEVDALLLYPLRSRDRWEELGLGKRRTALIIGDYGTGKTSLVKALATEAVHAGWTFMSVLTGDMESLPAIVKGMQPFKPVVLFFEDIDSVTMESDEGGRGMYVNMILNVLDGAEATLEDTMILMTSNYADRISPALKRPGRVDSIIVLERPDKATAGQIFTLYNGLEGTPRLYDLLEGMSPAEIKEVISRARLLEAVEDNPAYYSENADHYYLLAAEQVKASRKIVEQGGVRLKRFGFREEQSNA